MITSNTTAPRRPHFMSRSFPDLRLALAHVADTLARDRFRIGRVVEDLDRHPAAVRTVNEGLEDRYEVDRAEAGAALVGVVGVEVAGACGVAADELRHRRLLRRHRLYVEV